MKYMHTRASGESILQLLKVTETMAQNTTESVLKISCWCFEWVVWLFLFYKSFFFF